MHAANAKIVPVSEIRVNHKKLRKLSGSKIAQYMRAYDRGDAFPPIVVEDNGSFYTINDGRHRYQAQLHAGYLTVEVVVR
jgi:ParB-like chromosome segregation protein Spo0J